MTAPVVWQGLDHAALHEAVVNGGLGPAVSMDAEQQWRRMGKLITDIEGRLTVAMRESESEWAGDAADAARTGISPLGRWAIDAAQDAATTAEAVTAHAYGAATLRSQLRDNPPVPSETIMEALDRNATYGPQGATPVELAIVQAEQARRDEAAAKAAEDARVYENIGFESRRTLDFWTVPPTVTVEPASALAPSGSAGGLASGGWASPAGTGGSTAVAPAGSVELPGGAGPGAAGPSAAGPSAVAQSAATPATAGPTGGAVPGGVVPLPGGGAGPGGRGVGTAIEPAGRGTPGGGRGGGGSSGPTSRTPPTPGPYSPGSPTPIGRPAPSSGGRGTGPGPWTRAATDPRPPPGPRPVVPGTGTPPRTPSPGWRSVVLPAEPPVRAPAEPAVRSGTGAGGTAGQATGARTSSTHGMYPPMAGAGGAGQGTERRRPAYLIDDSGVFADRRWVQPAVITPADLIPDEHGRLPGQDGRHE